MSSLLCQDSTNQVLLVPKRNYPKCILWTNRVCIYIYTYIYVHYRSLYYSNIECIFIFISLIKGFNPRLWLASHRGCGEREDLGREKRDLEISLDTSRIEVQHTKRPWVWWFGLRLRPCSRCSNSCQTSLLNLLIPKSSWQVHGDSSFFCRTRLGNSDTESLMSLATYLAFGNQTWRHNHCPERILHCHVWWGRWAKTSQFLQQFGDGHAPIGIQHVIQLYTYYTHIIHILYTYYTHITKHDLKHMYRV